MTEESPKGKNDFVMTRIQQVQYAIEKLGFPLLVCLFLGFLLWHKMEQLDYKIMRTVRNTRTIMEKMGIPVIVAKDDWEKP